MFPFLCCRRQSSLLVGINAFKAIKQRRTGGLANIWWHNTPISQQQYKVIVL
jgi:hypothetical protein